MGKSHGKKTGFLLNGIDLGQYANNSQLELNPDTHDTTTYGKDDHVFSPGLGNGTLTVSGFYDTSTSTGPKAVIQPLVKVADVPFVHRPEGIGSGLPQDAGVCLITKYTQTSPVADYVTWSIDLQISDSINSTPQ